MQSIEKMGKTFEEAVAAAVRELNVSENDVETEILEQGSKGFFGIGAKPFKVKVTVKFNPEAIAKDFLREVIVSMGISATPNIVLRDRNMTIDLTGTDASRLIGKHGQTLDSLQYLVSLVVNKGQAPFINISMDCENYRHKRKETLENLARNLAKKAKATRRNVVLEPMTPQERRIIHAALQNDRGVATYSEGEEPYRNVVISPKRSTQ